MRPKVSVIIPVYNAENYIEQCMKSVMAQTLKEVEIIVVNDCSPDRSVYIVKELQREDNRIIIINNEDNLGAGPSRNAGLQFAKGEGIQFLDADDWLEPMALEHSYQVLKKTGTQFVSFGMKRSTSPNGTFNQEALKESPDANKDAGEPFEITDNTQWIDMLSKKEISVYIWDKLYDAAFLKKNNLWFDEMYATEDYAFNFKLYPFIKKIVMIPDVFYHFRVNPSSATQAKQTGRNVRAHLQLVCSAMKFVADQHLEKSDIGKRIIDDVFANTKLLLTRYLKHNRIDEEIENIIEDCVREYFGDGKESKLMSLLLLKVCKSCESISAFMKADNNSHFESYETFDKAWHVLSVMIARGMIRKEDRVVIYGMGNWGKCFYKALIHEKITVIGFTNSVQKEETEMLYGLPVIPVSKIRDTEYTKILIASAYYTDISRALDDAGYVFHKDYEYGPLW